MSGGRAERRLAKDSEQSRTHLITSGICCGICETLRAGMTVTPERLAAIRARCNERYAEGVPEFAVAVENWTRDLAGESRLAQG